MSAKKVIDLKDIESALNQIKAHIQRTPTFISKSATQMVGSETYLKYENTQTTGSFKIRGALNKILSLSAEDRKKGIITSSAGNHAQGVAFSARQMGTKAHIVMPKPSPIVKVLATQNYGANVILHGEMYDESYEHAKKLEKEKGYTFVHAYEDPYVIAGQGTLALEILEDIKDLESIVVPIGGGGLISGMSLAIKAINPKCKVYGVVAENASNMQLLYKKQKINDEMSCLTIADGIAVKKPSQAMLDNYISKYVDDIISVSDDEIAEAIVFLIERAKTIAEGSGAISLAAILFKKLNLGKKTCALLSGGNIDPNLVAKVIENGLTRKGRIARLTVIVNDLPGTLNKLTNIIAEKRGNILEVRHDRFSNHLHLRETAIEFLIETKGLEHIQEIREAFQSLGSVVKRFE